MYCSAYQAFTETNFTVQPDIKTLVSNKIMGITSTQLVEDCFNFQKNSKVVKGKKKFRRPEKTMGVILARQVLSKVHRYQEPTVDAPLSQRCVRLPATAFQPEAKPQKGGFPANQIVSTVAKAPWYSPPANSFTQQHADLALLSDASSSGKWPLLSSAWLGCLCKHKHKILLSKAGQEQKWFALHSWQDSAVLVWPAEEVTIPGSTCKCYTPALNVAQPVMLSMVELDTWQALSFQWKSVAWQYSQYPAALGALRPAIRAFAKPGP